MENNDAQDNRRATMIQKTYNWNHNSLPLVNAGCAMQLLDVCRRLFLCVSRTHNKVVECAASGCSDSVCAKNNGIPFKEMLISL